MAHVGTRGSRLARAQTAWVIERLRAAIPERRWLEVLISTTGDQNGAVALGTGVFVKEIEQALLDGAVDVAVHSLKDLPTDPTPGLTIAAIPQRADPRDCLVGGRLEDLPDGARVGTGSPRRAAQLRRLRPGLQVEGFDQQVLEAHFHRLARVNLQGDDPFAVDLRVAPPAARCKRPAAPRPPRRA